MPDLSAPLLARTSDAVVSFVFWPFRRAYRYIVVSEQRRVVQMDEYKEVRDELVQAQMILNMSQGLGPKWEATKDHMLRGVGLATAAPDDMLRSLIREYRDAFSKIADHWMQQTSEDKQALRDAFDGALERIAVLTKP